MMTGQLREGQRGTDNATGRPVVVRNGQVVFADQLPAPAFNTVRGAPPGVMSNQLGREDELLQNAADERSRLGTGAMQANRFGSLMENDPNRVFPATGGAMRFPPVQWAAGLVDQDVNEMEAINATLAPLQRQAGSGAMSDKDLAIFQTAVVNPANSEQANRSYIAITQAASRRANEYEQFLQEYRAQHGVGSLADAQRLWRQYSNANPLFDDNGRPLANVRPWREHFQPPAQQPARGRAARGPSGRTYTPAQVQAARSIAGGPRGRLGSATNPFMVNSQAQFNRLPRGAHFIDEDGVLDRKP
jgi:hypothetical protein